MRTGVWPPSSPAGTIAVSSCGDAVASRAGAPPMSTRGSDGIDREARARQW